MTSEAHVRIDEGIKRGPRKPKAARTALKAAGDPYTVALRPLHHLEPSERQSIANSVLDRYINGEQVAKIAPDYKVSDVTIYALLLREHQDAWKDIQTARALARLEKNQDELAVCDDALSLARAREGVRSAQWELERLLHRLYGQKQEVTVKTEVKIETVLDGDACALLAKMIVGSQAKAVAPSVSCTAIDAEYTVHPDSTQSK